MDVSSPAALVKPVTDTLERIAESISSALGVYTKTVVTTASLTALLIVLRYLSSKKKKKVKPCPYVTDHAKIARALSDEGGSARKEYDVVVVGGGTAGCAVAARLSEDPTVRVLLLEAGNSVINVDKAIVPVSGYAFFRTKDDWNLYTEPQEYAAGRKIYWPRARALGGCTNMNAMMYHYGAPSDYDEWAALQKGQDGANGWSYKEFHPYFMKYEKYTPNKRFPDVDVTYRGSTGPVEVGLHNHYGSIPRKFIEAADAVGIAKSHDVNTHKGTLGITKVLTYINTAGRRVTSEYAYLTPDVVARPNLTVALQAYTRRILFETKDGKLRASGVEFQDKAGKIFQVDAAKEVVLTAGAVHTPHILLLSGVGPADHLSSVGVPVVHDLPGVGSHLKDHPVVDLNYMDKFGTSFSWMRPANFIHKLQLTKAIFQYIFTKTGPLTSNLTEAAGFLRTSDTVVFPPDKFPQAAAPEDVTTGEAAPDIEIFSSMVAYYDHGGKQPPNFGHYNFSLHAVALRPKSSGTIRLKSNKPEDAPVIDPQYLADPNDVKVFIRGIRLLDRIAHTEPLKSIVDSAGDGHPELHHHLSEKTDAELEALTRGTVETLYHPACTARMAPLEDGGVVDPFLRVHGIPNLRVADASVFPSIVSGHTTGPVYAIAEKASDLIKAAIGRGSRK